MAVKRGLSAGKRKTQAAFIRLTLGDRHSFRLSENCCKRKKKFEKLVLTSRLLV